MAGGRCEHYAQAADGMRPRTSGCEECQRDGTPWVAIRMCLACGHVGCCDSSIGRHAARHFEQTGHPVMEAMPDGRWRWCYVHKEYD